LFETGDGRDATDASSGEAAGTLSWMKILVAAAPTTRKQVNATIMMTLVNKVSIPAEVWCLGPKLDGN
jgi:hypothetical protein